MKRHFIGLAVVLFSSLTLAAQNYMYTLRGAYERPVTQEKLRSAETLSDVVDGFPSQWITNYRSVDISVSTNGKTGVAHGNGHALSSEQKKLLQSAGLESKVDVVVIYSTGNSVTGKAEVRTATMKLTVVPFSQAAFPGGDKQLRAWFEKNNLSTAMNTMESKSQTIHVDFYVNSAGTIVDPVIRNSTGDKTTDDQILRLLKSMPAWKPAADQQGTNVSQHFEFKIDGNSGC